MKYRMSDIRNFVETTMCSTISEASRKLEISQPALSESIKNLEGAVGSTLFYRSRNGIQLTPTGRLFLDKAKNVFIAYESLEVNEKDTVFAGQTITIGCHSTVASYFAPHALKTLKKEAPDYKINFVHNLSRNIQTEVQKGNIDLGVVVNPVEVPDMIISKVSTDTVCVWSGKDIDRETVICNTNLFQTQSILKKWKDRPLKIISTDSLDLICRMTNEGIGYGILPEKAVAASRFKLKKLGSLPSYQDSFALAYRPEFGKTKAERLTIEAIKKAF